MATVTVNKLEREVASLRREVALLRMRVSSYPPIDNEGEYRPEFVAKIKRRLASTKKTPTRKFVDAQTFLKLIRKA